MGGAFDLLAYAAVAVFFVLSLWGAVTDIRRFEIPNWIPIGIVAAFAVFLFAVQPAGPTALWHVAAGIVVLVAGFVLFTLNVFGGGDAKLLAATAFWIGWQHLLIFVLLVSLLGGLVALFILLLRRMDKTGRGKPASAASASQSKPWLARLKSAEEGVPYGLAIGPAAVLVFPLTNLFHYSF